MDGWETYEGDEHRISRFDVHGSVLAVVDDVRICGFPVQAKCSCETDTLHCIVQEDVVCLRCVEFCDTVDFGKVCFAFSEIVVKCLSELCFVSATGHPESVHKLTT